MYTAIAANKRNTVLIMAVFVLLIGVQGWAFGYLYNEPSLIYLALVVAAVYALIQYFVAAKLALALNGAKEIAKRDNPRLYRTVENLAISTGQPMPKVYIIDDPAPNAFATGRDPAHAYVAATTGLIALLDDQELEGVIAHEIGHIQNYDIRVMMIVFGLVSAIGFIADMLLRMMWFGGGNRDNKNPALGLLALAAAVLAPVVAVLVQLAVSRQREYLADGTGALTTRYPEGLARALEKIGNANLPMRRQNTSTSHLFFANPLSGKSLTSLFSTHPPVAERIARLRRMGNQL